jgi:hypothetical protein
VVVPVLYPGATGVTLGYIIVTYTVLVKYRGDAVDIPRLFVVKVPHFGQDDTKVDN